MRQPINETFGPSPKPRHQYEFVWLLAAAAVSVMLWWSVSMIVQGLQVTDPLTGILTRVVSAVSGGK